MGVFSVRGFSQGTGGGAADLGICHLWNPDSAQRLKVLEVGVHTAGATGDSAALARTSVRGTPNSTVTPDADNSWKADDVPPSGALLDLAVFSTQPTAGDPRLFGMAFRTASVAGSAGTGFVWTMPYGFWVAPGSGLLVLDPGGTVNSFVNSECYFVWEEGA